MPGALQHDHAPRLQGWLDDQIAGQTQDAASYRRSWARFRACGLRPRGPAGNCGAPDRRRSSACRAGADRPATHIAPDGQSQSAARSVKTTSSPFGEARIAHIEAFVDQFDHTVGHGLGCVDGRILRGIVVTTAGSSRGSNRIADSDDTRKRALAATTARRADHLLGFFEFAEHLLKRSVVLAARLGRCDAARGAGSATRTELLLKRHHVLARHRRRYLHPFGRADKAGQLRLHGETLSC